MADQNQKTIDNALHIIQTVKEAAIEGSSTEAVQKLLQSCRIQTKNQKSPREISVLPPLSETERKSDAERALVGAFEEMQAVKKVNSYGDDNSQIYDKGGNINIHKVPVYVDDDQQNPDETPIIQRVGSPSSAGAMSDSGRKNPFHSSTPYATDDDAKSSMGDGMWQLDNIRPMKRQDISIASDSEVVDLLKSKSTPPTPALRRLNLPKMKALDDINLGNDSIKKGTDESTTLSGITMGSSSKVGATQSVHQSNPNQEESRAGAETVPRFVHSVRRTKKLSYCTDSEYEGYCAEEEDLDASLHDVSVVAEERITLQIIYDNQMMIIEKLDQLLALKNDVDAIKKQLTKNNLALSTIEGHLSSVMLAIPGSGKPYNDVETNPDLKPILGRDKIRAMPEIAYKNPRQIKINEGESSRIIYTMKPSMYLNPVSDTDNNATRFGVDDSIETRSVILSLIKTNIKDASLQKEMIHALSMTQGKNELEKFHQMLTSYIGGAMPN
ncbi:phosphoprotein [Longquan Berylmys bowersi morbillivirus 1]|uniref:Phosphoprotein n=1 Tax=Longquan Berylmys bowersi morbillivirus 1 TaxID=2877504 RepID=A0AAE8XS98_9MONO|nr:phosphoprotein [Longquan Berylmys bowersi morbillivirus 1]